MPSAFLRTFRKLHLYVHKTVQKHGITSILSYINIPTIRITTRFSLAKTYFQGNCLCSRWTVKKMKCSVNFSSFGRGPFEYEPALTFQKSKVKEKSKQFLPIIFGIHAKITACLTADTGLWRSMYTTPPTDFFIFFSHNQFAKSLWSVKSKIK